MNNYLKYIGFLILSLAFSSCLKNKLNEANTSDIVFTIYDSSVDFSSLKSFSIVDSIGKIDVSNLNSTDTLVLDPYRTIILDQIRLNLQNLGFTEKSNPDSADLWINVNVILNPTGEMISQYSYVDGNGEYQSAWWGSRFYFGAPDHWGVVANALYKFQIPNNFSGTSSSLMIEMLDQASYDSLNNKIYVPWFGAIRSALSGNDLENRLVNAIDQVFEQSQYLRN